MQHNRPGAPFEQTKVEKGKGAAYMTPLRDKKMGRIHRVYPKGSTHEPAPTQRLNAALADPSLVTRLHAQRLVVERDARAMIPSLKAAAAGEHGIHALHALAGLGALPVNLRESFLSQPSPAHRRTALLLWPSEQACAFDPLKEADPFVIREWLLLAARMPANEALGRKLRDWHRGQQQVRRGVVPDRCFAAAAARHSTGFLLASLETPPDPAVLKERIYPAAIRAFADGRSPQVMARLDDSPLGKALKEAVAEKVVVKSHQPPAGQLAQGEAIYARTCAACHQTNGSGVDGAFPPLNGSGFATGDPGNAIRIVLHGMTGPVELPGKATVNSLMPPMAGLSPEEIADVLTHVSHAWSNDAAPVTAAKVKKVRAATKDRATPWTARELPAR